MPFQDPSLDHLRAAIARIERGFEHGIPGAEVETLPFGIPAIDAALPGGGLAAAALHEITGSGIDIEFAAAPALFAAGLLARTTGPVLWVLQRRDLFAPALAAAGLHPDRVIYAEAGGNGADALLVMEEGLRQPGMGGVVAEISARVTLSASRRLHLAAQAGGAMALMLRRREQADGAIAAVTRWRIGPAPSAPPIPDAPGIPGLGRMRWRLDLLRCRGGRTGSWIVEACDAAGRLGLVSPLADGSQKAPFGDSAEERGAGRSRVA